MNADKGLQDIKFWYLPVRGDGDRIRLLLAESGIKYKEISIAGRELAAIKNGLPCRRLPVLEHNNFKFYGPNTIMRYIGKLAGLNGANEEEQVLVDMWCEVCDEIQHKLWASEYIQDPSEVAKETIIKEIMGEMRAINASLLESEAANLVGNKLSRADIALASLLDSINRELPTVLPCYPLLSTMHSFIMNRPNIAKFVASGNRY